MNFVIANCYRFSSATYKFDTSKNYYSILNIQQKSSKGAIRNAYLILAKKYHPDINPNGKQKFTLIQQAYQVLSDEKQRKDYDQFYQTHNNPSKPYQGQTTSQQYKSRYTSQNHKANKQYAHKDNPHETYKKYSQFKGQYNRYGFDQTYNNNSKTKYEQYDEQTYQKSAQQKRYDYEQLRKMRQQWKKQFYKQFGQNEKAQQEPKKQRTVEDEQYERMQFSFSNRNPFSPTNPKHQTNERNKLSGFGQYWEMLKNKFKQ